MVKLIADTWFPLFVNVCVQSTVLLFVAVTALCLMKRSSAARRHPVAALALGTLLVLPLLSWRLPLQWRVPLPQIRARRVMPIANGAAPIREMASAESSRTLMAVPSTSPRQHSSELPQAISKSSPAIVAVQHRIGSSVELFVLWLTGCVSILFRQAIVLVRLGLLARRSRDSNVMSIREVLNAVPSSSGICSRIRLIVDGDARKAAPVTWGVIRPVLLLPRDIDSWNTARIRAMLIHEVEHTLRADWHIQSAAQFACALYWFHPLAW